MARRPARQPRIQYDGRALVASHGAHQPVRAIIHDTESHDWAGIRDLKGIALFWHQQKNLRGKPAELGAQVGIDETGNSARYVDDLEVAWAVGGRNTGSLHIELIGFAAFTRDMWFRRPRQLHKCARWLAYWNKKFGVPLTIDVEHGVSTHAMQSDAFHTSTHQDPGKGFPLKMVVWLAKRYRRLGW